jgi:hypothetical protein
MAKQGGGSFRRLVFCERPHRRKAQEYDLHRFAA